MAVAGRSRIANVVVDIGDAGPFDYYLSYWPPAGIIDPGYNETYRAYRQKGGDAA